MSGFQPAPRAAARSRRSPASRPTCCGRWPPSWSSCCATRSAAPRDGRRPARAAAGLLRPDHRARRPGAGPAVPRRPTPTTRRRPASSAASPRATLRDGKARGRGAIIDTLEEAGLPPELDEDGLVIDVELDRAEAMTWMRSLTDIRLALATRLGVEEDDEELLARRCPTTTRAPTCTTSTTGWATSRRPWSTRSPAESQDADRAGRTTGRHRGLLPWTRAEHRPGDVRRDRRARQAGPPRRGVRRRRRARRARDRPERFVPMVNAARSPTFYEFDSDRAARSSTRRWTTATRSRW